MLTRLTALTALMLTVIAAPVRAQSKGGDPKAPLYLAFGGKEGIQALVDDFIGRVLADARVRKRFTGADVKHFKELSVAQICQSLGGPCVYHGKDMVSAHLGMHINEAEYDAVSDDMQQALDARQIPKDAQRIFMTRRESNRVAIVSHASTNTAAAAAAAPIGSASATVMRAQDFHDAAKILEMADSARSRGNPSAAARLFYSVELLVGSEAVAELHALYAGSAPPRLRTPLATLPADTPRQPRVVQTAPEERAEPTHGSVNGRLVGAGRAISEGVGLVTLKPLDRASRPRTPQTRTMEQRGRDFAPHLLVVPVGSTVSFPNFDPVYHNVYSSSEPKQFDLGVYRNGESRDVVFDKPGIISVECSVHENMLAYIVVVDEPYSAVVEDGAFSFRALPPGRYRLRAWTEYSGRTTDKEIVVQRGKNVLSIEVDGRASDRRRTDKFGNPRN